MRRWNGLLFQKERGGNLMTLPAEMQFHEDIRLLVYRPRGLLSEAAVNKVVSVLADLEASIEEPFNRFTDTTATDEVELNFKYIIHVSLYRRLTYAGRPPVKSAILATDSTIIHYARLHAVLTQGSPIHVCIFQDLPEAARWLNAPVERLTEAKAAATDMSPDIQLRRYLRPLRQRRNSPGKS